MNKYQAWHIIGLLLLGTLVIVPAPTPALSGAIEKHLAEVARDELLAEESSSLSQNLVLNPGFEAGSGVPDGWATFPLPIPGAITYTWDASTAFSGTRSAAVEVSGASAAMWNPAATWRRSCMLWTN